MTEEYREIPPSARLRRYVECYWLRGMVASPQRQVILPDGCVDILFSRCEEEPAALNVVGLMTAPKWVAATAGWSYFGARLRPAMATAFLRDAAMLNDRIEPLASLWGAPGRVLLEQLAEARTPEKMVAVMDAVLMPSEIRGLHEARSERHARRLCVDLAGVPPKLLSRILRFRNAADRIVLGQPNWAQFAAACGYYDQAHMIREFQEFAGFTPGRYLQYLDAAGV